jgi:hypothetical protein
VTVNPVTGRVDVRLNEVLPAPAAVDWDGDGVADDRDEWIELYNAGSGIADLSGWLLDAAGGGTPYQIPAGTVLQPGAFAVFYRQRTGIILDDNGGEVRLLVPGGAGAEMSAGRRDDRLARLLGTEVAVLDAITFGPMAPDASYSRDQNGGWHGDWLPSPGQPNMPVTSASA